jgi:hypothetical protein
MRASMVVTARRFAARGRRSRALCLLRGLLSGLSPCLAPRFEVAALCQQQLLASCNHRLQTGKAARNAQAARRPPAAKWRRQHQRSSTATKRRGSPSSFTSPFLPLLYWYTKHHPYPHRLRATFTVVECMYITSMRSKEVRNIIHMLSAPLCSHYALPWAWTTAILPLPPQRLPSQYHQDKSTARLPKPAHVRASKHGPGRGDLAP